VVKSSLDVPILGTRSADGGSNLGREVEKQAGRLEPHEDRSLEARRIGLKRFHAQASLTNNRVNAPHRHSREGGNPEQATDLYHSGFPPSRE
jgi:hypothetical protein